MAEEEMPVVPPSRGDDLHNLDYMEDADLTLFMAGNQFMVMEELVEAFQKRHPGVEKVFYETLPPGLELRQILAGGARFKDRTLTGRPDVYSAVTEDAMKTLKGQDIIEDYSVYLHNRLVLMVAEGNPKGIAGVEDLARDDVRISQPGDMEDITQYITAMYRQAGGEELLGRIMEEKRAEATTILTIVHHRETPLRITRGTSDVGPVWATEVENARRQGLKLEAVDVGPDLDQHDAVNYYIAQLKEAKNKENARAFMDFIRSKEAQEIYRKYGFVPEL